MISKVKPDKSVVSKPWTMKDLDRVIKSLKNNQTRGPLGMLNALFKPGVIGQDLKKLYYC